MPSRCDHILQDTIGPSDGPWSYTVPSLASLNSDCLVKSIELQSDSISQAITLRLIKIPDNRATSSVDHEHLIHVVIANFRLHDNTVRPAQPASARESADYLARFLKSGIGLNGTHYSFYGHSNSQLKSRSCYLRRGSQAEVDRTVEALGDFTKIKTVAKKVKRIGLLFSTADRVLDVAPERCKDIPDIEDGDFNFTDGCGLISLDFAKLLVRKKPIIFRNQRYLPSVFQIRYRGYKGVVTLDPKMQKGQWLQLRNSMKKFAGSEDLSFAVVEYSKVGRLLPSAMSV
jgi:RNA dependent RNA polymerase